MPWAVRIAYIHVLKRKFQLLSPFLFCANLAVLLRYIMRWLHAFKVGLFSGF
jgi:hypothetical protein